MPRYKPDSSWSAVVIAVLFGVIAAFLAWSIMNPSAGIPH
jgi:hypothetical protein